MTKDRYCTKTEIKCRILALLDRIEKKALECRRQHKLQERMNERWFHGQSQTCDNEK